MDARVAANLRAVEAAAAANMTKLTALLDSALHSFDARIEAKLGNLAHELDAAVCAAALPAAEQVRSTLSRDMADMKVTGFWQRQHCTRQASTAP